MKYFVYLLALAVVFSSAVLNTSVDADGIDTSVQLQEKPPEFPKDEPVNPEPTEDEKIVPKSKDDVNEDPSDKPNGDLAENPNDKDGDNESPHPKKNSKTSGIGLGTGVGLGGSGGEAGNSLLRRRSGDAGGKPKKDRVTAALNWLKSHQNESGSWSSTTFSEDSARKNAKNTYNVEFVDVGDASGDQGWGQTTDVGLTGLALMAFAGAGYDHSQGDYKNTCRSGVLYLRRNQSADGCFGPREDDHFVYNHAIATIAIIEIHGLRGAAVLKPVAEKAIEFILKCQNPSSGWRYGIQPGQNDSSVTAWMVQALKSAKLAGLGNVKDIGKSFDGAEKWYEMVTVENDGYLKTGYNTPGSGNARLRSARGFDNNPTMDAIYTYSMLAMDKRSLRDRDIKELSLVCTERSYLPKWEQNKIDYYYWYFGSMAMFQVGGTNWKKWEPAMSKTLCDNQRGYSALDKRAKQTTTETLDEHGSWDSVGAWGTAGGRVYSTAMNCLTLETYSRYMRFSDEKLLAAKALAAKKIAEAKKKAEAEKNEKDK